MSFFACGGSPVDQMAIGGLSAAPGPLAPMDMAEERRAFTPTLPRAFANIESIEADTIKVANACEKKDEATLAGMFATCWGQPLVQFNSPFGARSPSQMSLGSSPSNASILAGGGRSVRSGLRGSGAGGLGRQTPPSPKDNKSSPHALVPGREPLRLGVVLSGGQAPGGHTVIAGVFDFAKKYHPESMVFGFLNGPRGIYNRDFIPIDDELIYQYRNMGGFHMLRSGRDKISKDSEKAESLSICNDLNLNGLIIIGGDDSNTNGLVLGEYFAKHDSKCVVVGAPKTIDGDMRSEYIEISFGFDTAAKAYCEEIGNIMVDAVTSRIHYHFIRVMGRSASHLALECAMQCHPNMVLIGEEMEKNKTPLRVAVGEIADMVVARKAKGLHHGVVIIPEGLVEFVPDFVSLIKSLTALLKDKSDALEKMDTVDKKMAYIGAHLPSGSDRALFDKMPKAARSKMVFERDPHGNIPVSAINTEKLIMDMVAEELQERKFDGQFRPRAHFMGYEGRCVMPTNFDTAYCYCLGNTAALCASRGMNGYVVQATNLDQPDSAAWVAGACPLTSLMHIEQRGGAAIPVIKKYLVQLESPGFLMFKGAREQWKTDDFYRSIGPIQYYGMNSNDCNYQVRPPAQQQELLCRTISAQNPTGGRGPFSPAISNEMSPVVRESPAYVNSSLKIATDHSKFKRKNKFSYEDMADVENEHGDLESGVEAQLGALVVKKDMAHKHNIKMAFPHMCPAEIAMADLTTTVCDGTLPVSMPSCSLRVGVALCGPCAPASGNVLFGLFENVSRLGGTLYGFYGIDGLIFDKKIEMTLDLALKERNQAGFTLLGRSPNSEHLLDNPETINQIIKTVNDSQLTSVVLIGGQLAMGRSIRLAELMAKGEVECTMTFVPVGSNGDTEVADMGDYAGYATSKGGVASLLGALAIDNISSSKYWYFVRVPGGHSSCLGMEVSIETHPNLVMLGEEYRTSSENMTGVVDAMAKLVVARQQEGKSHGVIVIPDNLVFEMYDSQEVIAGATRVRANALGDDKLDVYCKEIEHLDENMKDGELGKTHYLKTLGQTVLQFLAKITPEQRFLCLQPRRIHDAVYEEIPLEMILAEQVKIAVARMAQETDTKIPFAPISFYFGPQTTGAYPVGIDQALGYAHGLAAGKIVAANLHGYFTCIKASDPTSPAQWEAMGKPIALLIALEPDVDRPHDDKRGLKKKPIIEAPKDVVGHAAYITLTQNAQLRAVTEHYVNPGPSQIDLSRRPPACTAVNPN